MRGEREGRKGSERVEGGTGSEGIEREGSVVRRKRESYSKRDGERGRRRGREAELQGESEVEE